MDKLTQKIISETGLQPKEIKFYEFFYMSAGLIDKVIMYDEVKFRIWSFARNNFNLETPKEFRDSVEEIYDYWLNYFKEKGLIHQYKCQYELGAYPVLKGYTPFDDNEFYIPYRTKGGKKWNGRISIEYFKKEKKDLEEKCEFDLEGYKRVRRQQIQDAIQDAKKKGLIELSEHLTSELEVWEEE